MPNNPERAAMIDLAIEYLDNMPYVDEAFRSLACECDRAYAEIDRLKAALEQSEKYRLELGKEVDGLEAQVAATRTEIGRELEQLILKFGSQFHSSNGFMISVNEIAAQLVGGTK